MRHDGIEFGQFVAVRFDESQFVGRDVFFEINGRVLRHAGEVADFLAHVFGAHVQTLGDEVGVSVEVAGGVAHHERGEGRIVIDDDAAFAVEDFAAGSEDGHLADTILFRLRGVVVVAGDLQAPQSVSQHEEHAEDAVLHGGEAH